MRDQRVFSTQSDIESVGIQKALKAENIDFDVIDKTDSAYATLLGSIDILVEEKDRSAADQVVKDYFKD
jgi:hypothetical protein